MATTKDGTIRSATKDYLDSYTGGKSPDEISEEILMITKNYFDMYNAAGGKSLIDCYLSSLLKLW